MLTIHTETVDIDVHRYRGLCISVNTALAAPPPPHYSHPNTPSGVNSWVNY